ncbi:MAG: hypothetical protein HKN36_14020 [Hellea sp.]|nr:hypothetical protein [Hellea sp.]
MEKLPKALLIIRLSIAFFLLHWVIDKIAAPQHTAAVFKNFYFVNELPASISYVLGGLFAVLLLAFTFGFKKRLSYGLVALVHGAGTIMILNNFIPFTDAYKIVFVASIPVLGAMIALYILRDHDTVWTVYKAP